MKLLIYVNKALVHVIPNVTRIKMELGGVAYYTNGKYTGMIFPTNYFTVKTRERWA